MIIDVNQKVEELASRTHESCDICEHFPLIEKYGKQSEHITEMGVRSIVSTWGWVAAKPKTFICYDKDRPTHIQDVYDTAESLGIAFAFHEANTTAIEIEETDLLFIDTDHNYEQMQKELELHGNKARKFLVFHDTAWAHDMNRAIKEFMDVNPHWVDEEEVTNNNGFKIIKRI
jgi:hypothetical protein